MGGRPSAGGAGGAGEGGAGGAPDPCEGVMPRCEPGEVACDPMLGKLGTCDACGAVAAADVDGPDCARIIASDKESRVVCVVLGSDRLQCWPGWGTTTETIAPRDTVDVLLPDDGAHANGVTQCFLSSAGLHSCLPSSECARVHLSDTALCGICSGKLYCKDERGTKPPEIQAPIDIGLTDDAVVLVGSLGVQAYDITLPLPSEWKGAPVSIAVDHQHGGCIVSDQQEVSCWANLTDGLKPSRWSGSFKKLAGLTLPRACTLDQARRVGCGDVFEDAAPTPVGDADSVGIAVSSYQVCSLSVAGRVKCWSDLTGEPVAMPPGW
jgi:hypothetical protein